MRGKMMSTPLTITEIMLYATRLYHDTEVISITSDEGVHRSTYKNVFERANQVAHALRRLGVKPGDRIATLAWNDHRHLELYYGVSCSGLVLHTVNPRLFSEQLAYIFSHANDQVIFFDPMFLPLLEGLADELSSVKAFVALTSKEKMPESSSLDIYCYEELLAQDDSPFSWPELEETTASALCYTSGTTGNPKGVLYDHRSTVLHAYGSCMAGVLGLSHNDVVMPVVPMFHVNAWGTPYSCPIAGSKIVLPGPKMGDGETLHSLIENEGVTIALGVPTVWLALLAYLKDTGKTIGTLNRTVVGGSACPISIMEEFEKLHGVYTHHAWGMTEMSPLGTVNTLIPSMDKLEESDRNKVRAKQGRAPFGVDMKIVDDEGKDLPHDGVAFGDLKVRGWWVADAYYGEDDNSETHDQEGWFSTGDVATIDQQGFLNITDRTKDVIKSGGEWISSIELENIAVAHPDVAEAAVIGIDDEKWGERPHLIVVCVEGADPVQGSILSSFKGKVADWWIPDSMNIVDSIPHTATGKISKATLREQHSKGLFE
ncbi:MAG: long-chain fatty acid--CoA ligase [Rhodospirillaceae bacterium]|nr:long-chain fatty acid--CoA ligase [Rhodospirillaceae bacterium]